MWKQITVGSLLLVLCGCIKIKDELMLNADGSGQVRIEMQSSFPPEVVEGMGLSARIGGATGGVIYPPVSEAEARKFFPGKDFRITVKQQKADSGEVTTVIEAEFKDINALLASPYGRAHQLAVKISGGSLVVQGVTGMEAAARFAEVKDGTGIGLGMGAMAGFADLQKKKGEMRAEFRLTLPHAIASATGARDGKTAVWIVERAKCKDAEDFARQLGAVSEARCAAVDLKMTPVTPVRMGLRTFSELAEGLADAGTTVNTNIIAAAVKFVPLGMSVTRSLDLSGEGGSQESGAQLTGAILVPKEFAPHKWGEPKLSEVVDVKGNDLKPGDSDETPSYGMRGRYSDEANGDDEENVTNTSLRHVITFAFRPPEWKINEIARIKGSVNLQYFGGSQVVKMANTVPAKAITDVSMMMGGGSDSSEKSLDNARLAGLGLSLSLQRGLVQSGMTALTLQTVGKQAALTDAQVFDADGRPWPTFLQRDNLGGDDDADTCEIVIAGKPQPPLSLALLVSGSGVTVEVPILLEHVSLAK